MQKIMIVEDETSIREELVFLLKNEGYAVAAVTNFTEAPGWSDASHPARPCVLAQINYEQPDLILLDLGLPGRDGFALCADIRKNSSVPIIFVTSRDAAMDELRALSLGGDDYITKPYNIPLLLARIKTVLRRGGKQTQADGLQAKGLSLDPSKGCMSANGHSRELTRNEIRILDYLMTRAGEIVSRAELIEALWDSRIYIDDNTLSVNMTRLRAKLAEVGLSEYIKTRRGMGYQI